MNAERDRNPQDKKSPGSAAISTGEIALGVMDDPFAAGAEAVLGMGSEAEGKKGGECESDKAAGGAAGPGVVKTNKLLMSFTYGSLLLLLAAFFMILFVLGVSVMARIRLHKAATKEGPSFMLLGDHYVWKTLIPYADARPDVDIGSVYVIMNIVKTQIACLGVIGILMVFWLASILIVRTTESKDDRQSPENAVQEVTADSIIEPAVYAGIFGAFTGSFIIGTQILYEERIPYSDVRKDNLQSVAVSYLKSIRDATKNIHEKFLTNDAEFIDGLNRYFSTEMTSATDMFDNLFATTNTEQLIRKISTYHFFYLMRDILMQNRKDGYRALLDMFSMSRWSEIHAVGYLPNPDNTIFAVMPFDDSYVPNINKDTNDNQIVHNLLQDLRAYKKIAPEKDVFNLISEGQLIQQINDKFAVFYLDYKNILLGLSMNKGTLGETYYTKLVQYINKQIILSAIVFIGGVLAIAASTVGRKPIGAFVNKHIMRKK